MRVFHALLLTLCLAAVAGGAARAGDERLAPIPRADASSTHGPFEMGACEVCHERADPRNPGAAVTSDDLCFQCHDEFRGSARVRLERGVHPASKASCVGCHSPHNSRNRKLLLH